MIGLWYSLPGAVQDDILPVFEPSPLAHAPTSRGPKVVERDPYLGPDIDPRSGAYTGEPIVDDGYMPFEPAPAGIARAPSPPAAATPSFLPWLLGGVALVAAGVGLWLFAGRSA